MKRIIVFVDGFNLYHSLDENKDFHKYKWLNLRKLSEMFLVSNESISEIRYFSAYAFWEPQKVKRHKIYVNALISVGVKPTISEFKTKDRKCKCCGKKYQSYEEKQTDVQIAINLFKEAIDDSFDKAIIISGDSDLIPALEAVRLKFPTKGLHILFPPNRAVESIKSIGHSYSRIREYHLANSQFPAKVSLGDNQFLDKPAEWQ